ncbi:arsenate reductase [Neptunitalea chrysea]|uniref:Arsenate reductase n=1 Tax=Neptunitalea chrysea TaxID=1647581 RepID=A0A9W6B311_9FLAO|nr:protein-tyrosine-phosphatase [Neptunitalea chrysea]GLB51601.1 arsenate reductase [Neptunitalea chrysea]
MALYPKIFDFVKSLSLEGVSEERKKTLQPLIEFIETKVKAKEAVRINFICTHNSRRSVLSQVWAQALAHYFNIENLYCYSGGTEATAVYPEVIKTLAASGFKIETLSEGNNPVYAIKYSAIEHPVIGFSKTFDSPFNPDSGFVAIMTCSSADAGCPFVPGSERRVPVTYEDPKQFDESPLKAHKYMERSIQIASELFYVFSEVKSK